MTFLDWISGLYVLTFLSTQKSFTRLLMIGSAPSEKGVKTNCGGELVVNVGGCCIYPLVRSLTFRFPENKAILGPVYLQRVPRLPEVLVENFAVGSTGRFLALAACLQDNPALEPLRPLEISKAAPNESKSGLVGSELVAIVHGVAGSLRSQSLRTLAHLMLVESSFSPPPSVCKYSFMLMMVMCFFNSGSLKWKKSS